MGKLIFLDFDGVLRRDDSPKFCFDQDCLEYFEGAIRHCPKSKIVITSTWRLAVPLKMIKSYFSPDVGSRIVGVTPECLDDEEYVRLAEVNKYLESKKLIGMPWVAIDDDPQHYSKGSPVLLTNPKNGFNAESAKQLVQLLIPSA